MTKFKNSAELKKWMADQKIERYKARGKKLDALSARFFKEDRDRLNEMIASLPDNGEG